MAEVDFQSLRSGKEPEPQSRRDDIDHKEPVTKHNAQKKKTNPATEFFGIIFDCTLDEAWDIIKSQRILPDLKRLGRDSITDMANVLLGGGAPRTERRSSLDRDRGGYNDYKGISNNRSGSNSDNRISSSSSSRGFDSRDYVFDSRGEADKALWDLQEECSEADGKVSVAFFLNMIGQTSEWTDWDIGWFNLNNENSYTRMSGSKWVIVLPRPVRIK